MLNIKRKTIWDPDWLIDEKVDRGRKRYTKRGKTMMHQVTDIKERQTAQMSVTREQLPYQISLSFHGA